MIVAPRGFSHDKSAGLTPLHTFTQKLDFKTKENGAAASFYFSKMAGIKNTGSVRSKHIFS